MIYIPKARGIEVCNNVQMEGAFKLVKRSAGGIILQETPWFDNLILDAGLNRWFTGQVNGGISIGTGTSAPVASQTALDAFSAYTSTVQVSNSITAQGSAPYYITHTYAYRFGLGTLNGNYTEIGFGWASNTLFSRALIVDNLGAPTSISVGLAEQLDAYYQLRRYVPAVDDVVSKTIGGVATTVTGRACNCTNVSTSPPSWNGDLGVIQGRNLSTWLNASNGAIGAVTAAPSGTLYQSAMATGPAAVGSYVNNSLSRTYRNTYGLNEGNLSGGIGAVVAAWQGLGAAFQYGFSPAVAKDATKTFTFDYTVSISRRP